MKIYWLKLKTLFVTSLLLGFLPITCIQYLETQANTMPFFFIDILAPNLGPSRPVFPDFLIRELPKIGIGIDTYEATGWGNIAPRVWGHPGPYPVGTYDEGGFDILFLGWGWGLDVEMQGLFDTPSWPPNGDNFYQYSRPEMDWALGNFSRSITGVDRLFWVNEIQQLLYEDLPAITIVYPEKIIPYDENLTGWDELMWVTSQQPMENWTIPGQTEFRYAVPADFRDFHPMKADRVYDYQWLSQIYDRLIIRDSETKGWTNRLALNLSSNNGYNYSVHLNQNVKWADGQQLNASDVEFSYNLFIDPNFMQPDYNHYCHYINNESVKVINEFEVEFNFLNTYVFQEDNLALPIIPKHIWEPIAPKDQEIQALNWSLDDTLDSQKIIGSGPYVLDDFNFTRNVIRLKRNDYFDDWTGVTPYFEFIYFEYYPNMESALLALDNKSIDMIDSRFYCRIEDVENLNGTSYSKFDVPGASEIGLNQLHPYFGTGELCPIPGLDSARYVRKAISHIVPREEIIQDALSGIGRLGVTPYPSAAFGFNSSLEPYAFDIELAKDYMRLAGFVYPEDTTIRFSFTNLSIFLGFIALIGGCYFFIHRKK